MRPLLFLGLLAACDDAGHWPGSNQPPVIPPVVIADGGPRPDATDGDAAPAMLHGALCELAAVTARSCAPLAATLEVELVESGATTTTGADGSFSLPLPADAVAVTLAVAPTAGWTGGALRLTLPHAGAVSLPLLSRTLVEDVIALNGLSVLDGQGSIVVHADGAAGPLAGVTLAASGVLYDVGDPEVFSTVPPTGALGTALLLGVAPGEWTLVGSAGTKRTSVTAAVVADSVSVVTLTL